MDFLVDYGLFLAKTVTVVGAFLIAVAFAYASSQKGAVRETLKVEHLNKKYESLANVVRSAVLSKEEQKQLRKQRKAEAKARKKSSESTRKHVYVIDFKGDIRASAVGSLRQEITAVLALATSNDEIVVRLENAGGVVHDHGLAASQLERVKAKGIPLTVTVDKVAASGGYMMACVADRIIAAPFAIVGSIGVIAQLPNFSRLLDSSGIDFEQITAGEYKRTVTMFGKNTEADRAKLREELEVVHNLFKGLVAEHRPQLDVEAVATGEHWYGLKAVELKLVDEIMTSDDHLVGVADTAELYQVSYQGKKRMVERLMGSVDSLLERAIDIIWRHQRETHY